MHRTDKINGYINLENDPVWSCMHVWEDNIKMDINETGCGNLFIYLFTAAGLLPGGSGYFTCKQNMKLVTTKFKSGGLWEACSGNLESWKPSQHLPINTGKPRKTCVEVVGRRTFRILTSSQQSGI